MTAVDQTYLAIIGAGVLQASHNARILAEHGNQQLGRPWTPHPGLRIWNGNTCQLGHIDPAAFLAQVNAALPAHMYVDHAHHEHVHLRHLAPPPGYDNDPATRDWVHCAPGADGAVPITIAITQTRQ
ncbi:hypothetical protein E6R18_32860 [Streptomyces sp. A1277]|uniref:hypothetical protein n=1 Tax=Streptomyces sp. A1277 TaxID=2563103 RepID=UPI0010A26551|nr:hypothetical protein [Streptomyces sp. A1277]THA22739.1 hypothetical protein E6R18_32860 [Streptomyces sp. A1277]